MRRLIMTANTPLAFEPVHQLCDRMSRGEITPVDIVGGYLDRIARYDAKLHAYIDVYTDDARRVAHAAAEAIASGHRIGPLHGIPVAVKDLVEINGRVTTGGCGAWRDRRSTYTATLVEKMLAAGMIVLGKTHTVQFAMGGWGTNQQFGTPWNPWDLTVHRTPGGSSAGSGVAVAAGLAPWAIGTDTGGSVRIPSAWCGLAGLKTTIGRISTYGVLPLAATLDTPGPMARDVEDAAVLFTVLQGADARDMRTRGVVDLDPLATLKRGARGCRVAVMPHSERQGVDPEILASFDASLDVLANLGAEVVQLDSLPLSFADFAARTGTIIYAEGYSVVGDLCDKAELPLDEDVRPRILAGKRVSARQYLDALAEMGRIKAQFAAALDAFDVLATPTVATPAMPLEHVDQTTTPAGFTRAVNFLERCALTVPNGFTRDGLPSGLQLIGRPYDEGTVLRIGWAYEQATEWHQRRPAGVLD
jgi:aspartyl-tRNA(Asn)/glutamyl-tRNA(Gln) amidotransferase subunit A